MACSLTPLPNNNVCHSTTPSTRSPQQQHFGSGVVCNTEHVFNSPCTEECDDHASKVVPLLLPFRKLRSCRFCYWTFWHFRRDTWESLAKGWDLLTLLLPHYLTTLLPHYLTTLLLYYFIRYCITLGPGRHGSSSGADDTEK